MHFGGVDVVELAERFGTPLIVTDEARVRENFRAYKEAFNAFKEEVAVVEDVEIYYAVKANWSLAILRVFSGLRGSSSLSPHNKSQHPPQLRLLP